LCANQILNYICKIGRIVAIDFGLKRTGLAMTDEMNIIASPLTTVESKILMSFLKTLTEKNKIDTLVLGEPKRLNNEDTHITENVRLLKTALEKEFPALKIVLMDERFTSKMAFQSMIDSGMKKKQRQEKGTIDMISAAIILQSYLEKR
jgi:putative Holliday junction resolvase